MTDLVALWSQLACASPRGHGDVGRDVWHVEARIGNFLSGCKPYDSRPISGIILPNDGPRES